MAKKRIAVGLSGGIDSTVAAYLLKRKGFEVLGFTLKFYPQENRCCDLDSLDQAKRLCHFLDIPHYVLDVGDSFRTKVIDYFSESYLKGQTPNPCAYCNRFIKFGIFFEKVKSFGADYLATGHYTGLVKKRGTYLFRKAKDLKKSQEYFLSLVRPDILKFLIFPLTNYTKPQVEKIAKDKKLLFKQRKESQDVCFVKDKQYPQFIEENLKSPASYAGNIVDQNGDVLGKHKGIYYYTYGQRSGLGVAHKHPLYVTAIDSQSKNVIVGNRDSLCQSEFLVHSVNWFTDPGKRKVKVKVRYNAQEVPCSLDLTGNRVKVRLVNKIDSIAPGQVAAFYYKDLLLGAGIIVKA
ncbi:MAG: tRNA 2-thiouridine(34) synthase MnmA [Candidatus Omnitrophica bacterium]|nr:tRNA 2-thiouridine(34) synthase MnmA [Candidatus Omnitrophota bacterium]